MRWDGADLSNSVKENMYVFSPEFSTLACLICTIANITGWIQSCKLPKLA